jgi:nucleoid DNA-binding protein
MLKQEISEKISQFFKVTEFEAEKIFDDIFLKIIDGVKEDNIVDVVNFGEFIVKYNNEKNGGSASPYKKTIEFLASVNLEDEIGHKSYDIYKSPTSQSIPPVPESTTKMSGTAGNESAQEIKPVQPEKSVENKIPEKEFHEAPVISETKFSNELEKVEKPSAVENSLSGGKEYIPVISDYSESTHEGPVNIEEEFKKKREALLNKISIHPLQDSTPGKKEHDDKTAGEEFNYFIREDAKDKETQTKIDDGTGSGNTEDKKEEIKASQKEESTVPLIPAQQYPESEIKSDEDVGKSKIHESIQETAKSYYDEDLSNKSFADYFTEINKDEHFTPVSTIKSEEKPGEKEKPPEVIPPLPQIIPPKAVELHKEITGTGDTTNIPADIIPAPPVEKGSGDKSYYIWYKDSEPNVSDTQTMSYEYELLYQATKEAEYKSKLKIYVTTFILFFSVVLVLLIFSPVIYKMFFTPVEQQSFQNADEQTSGDQVGEHKAQLNFAPVTANQNNPADTNNKTQTDQSQTTQQTQQNNETQQNSQQNNTQTQTQQTQTTQENTQPQQQNTEPSIEGVVKTTMGWTDDKYKVVYIKLDNGKYTIQESSWDSDAKANRRISIVDALKIPDMKGSVAKTDLGNKGVWYRTRFGEFNSIEEARKKAEELRSK